MRCFLNIASRSAWHGQSIRCLYAATLGLRSKHKSSTKWVIRDPYAGKKEAQPAGKQYPRFYVPPPELRKCGQGSVLELNTEETHHALRVLRLKERDNVEVCDGDGSLVPAVLAGLSAKNLAYVEVVGNMEKVAWQGPKWEVVAGCGSLKGGRSEWLVEKAVELGAFSLRPLLTRRSPYLGRMKVKVRVGSLDEESSQDEEVFHEPPTGREGRWERVALAAVKQSLRVHSLRIEPATQVNSIQQIIQKSALTLVATAGAPPVGQVLQREAQAITEAGGRGAPPALLLVGPEGDFTRAELDSIIGAGAHPVGLGPNRLRVETAAIALLTSATIFVDAALAGHGAPDVSNQRQHASAA